MRINNEIENGFVDEVKKLVKIDNTVNAIWKKYLGYADIYNFIENKITHNELINILEKKTWQLVKKQRKFYRVKFLNSFIFSNIENNVTKKKLNDLINYYLFS